MNNINSVLSLDRLVFDKLEFVRKGFQNENEIEFQIEIQVGIGDGKVSKVTLILKGNKVDEYDLFISLSGYFSFDENEQIENEQIMTLLNKNAVAILMPYLRSQASLLTAQPGMDCVVLPPFNINKMVESESTN